MNLNSLTDSPKSENLDTINVYIPGTAHIDDRVSATPGTYMARGI